jgi:hypothetical protein
MEASMRKIFLITLGATAMGLSVVTLACAQSAQVAPASDSANIRHSSRAGFDATARMNKAKIRRSVLIGGTKKDDSWFKEMRDPCQVEG